MLLEQPKIRRWTLDEYYAAVEMGWFDGQRVELVDGEVVEMPAHSDAHAQAVMMADERIRSAFGSGFAFRVQLPLRGPANSLPEPDIAVVPGPAREVRRHPRSALLVVEVSDTTLAYDRGRKSRLCAAAGVEDYWIVNLIERRVELRRRPAEDGNEPFGHDYTDIAVRLPGDVIAPLARPEAEIRVEELLPPVAGGSA